jgi:RNA polymerase sigma-70 factor (ECF subfamily)
MWMKIRARRRSCESAEDIIQDTFVRVFTALRRGGLRQPECLGAFVNSICSHVLLEYYRRECRIMQLDERMELIDYREAVEAVLESEEKRKLVSRILEGLSARDRDLLRQLVLEERDPESICKQHGVTRQYLRVLVHRAMKSARRDAETLTSGCGC